MFFSTKIKSPFIKDCYKWVNTEYNQEYKYKKNIQQAGAELCQAQFELGLDSAIAREPAWSAEAINQLVCTKWA